MVDVSIRSSVAETLERNTEAMVDEIIALARRELRTLQRPPAGVERLFRIVMTDQVTAMIGALREPTRILPMNLRMVYRDHGEHFADRALPLPDLTRTFELSGRVVLPHVLESIDPDAEGYGSFLETFLQSAVYRSTAAVSIVTRAYIDRTRQLTAERSRMRDELIADLVSGELTEASRARALALGFSAAVNYKVIVIDSARLFGDTGSVESAASEHFPEGWSTAIGSSYAIIAPRADRDDRRAFLERAASLAAAVRGFAGGDAIVAVGRARHSLEGIRVAYVESQSIVVAGRAMSLTGVITDRDVKLARIALAATEVGDHLDRLLAPLEAFGGRDSDALILSLDAFLDTGFSTVAAAAKLDIHRNTMTYRIELIERLIGASIVDVKLPLKLALVRRHLGRAGNGSFAVGT